MKFQLAIAGITSAQLLSDEGKFRAAIADALDGVSDWQVLISMQGESERRRLLTTKDIASISVAVVAQVTEV